MSLDGPAPLLLLVPVAALGVLAVQPGRAWRAGAEHSRWFWAAWVVTGLIIGAAGRAALGSGVGIAWLVLWCGLGSLQPSMIADVLDARRQRRRRPGPSRSPVPETEPTRPIHWQAPAPGEIGTWVPRAQAG